MNKIIELERIAERDNIEIIEIKTDKCKSMSVQTENGNCYIGIDSNKMTNAEEAVCKAHELGHCETGSFYNRYSGCDLVSKHEYRADVWAIKKLISKDEIVDAFEHGITEIWNLAEHFNVTEDFMRKACKYYGFLP